MNDKAKNIKALNSQLLQANNQKAIMDKYIRETGGKTPITKWLKDNGYAVSSFGKGLPEHLNACGCTMAADGKACYTADSYADAISKYSNKLNLRKRFLDKKFNSLNGDKYLSADANANPMLINTFVNAGQPTYIARFNALQESQRNEILNTYNKSIAPFGYVPAQVQGMINTYEGINSGAIKPITSDANAGAIKIAELDRLSTQGELINALNIVSQLKDNNERGLKIQEIALSQPAMEAAIDKLEADIATRNNELAYWENQRLVGDVNKELEFANNIDFCLDDIEKTEGKIKLLEDIQFMNELVYELIPLKDKKKDRIFDRMTRKNERRLNHAKAKTGSKNRKEGRKKIEAIFDIVKGFDGEISTIETGIDTYLFDLEKNKDNETVFDSIQAKIEGEEAKIVVLEAKIKAKEEEAAAVAGEDKALLRKLDRQGRQAARKDKRDSKKKRKDNLKNLYGKGSAYRAAKKGVKTEIKDEKKEDIKKYGGSFIKRLQSIEPTGALTRNAALALLKLNFANVAARIGKEKDLGSQKYTDVVNFFIKVGGDKTNLDKAVEIGKEKRPIIGKNGKYDIAFNAQEDLSVMGWDDALVIAGLVAQGGTLITGMIVSLGGKDKYSEETPPMTPNPLLPVDPTCVPNADGTTCTMPDGTKVDLGTGMPILEGSFMDKYKWYIAGGVGLIVVGGAAWLLLKK